MFERTIELTLIIIYSEMLPYLLLIQKLLWLYYLFNRCLWQRRAMYNWNALCCCQFHFYVTAFAEDVYITVCGFSPCPYFHEVFYERDRSVVTSASPQKQTKKKTHTCAHPHRNITACHHFRASFYQPEHWSHWFPKALLPFATGVHLPGLP